MLHTYRMLPTSPGASGTCWKRLTTWICGIRKSYLRTLSIEWLSTRSASRIYCRFGSSLLFKQYLWLFWGAEQQTKKKNVNNAAESVNSYWAYYNKTAQKTRFDQKCKFELVKLSDKYSQEDKFNMGAYSLRWQTRLGEEYKVYLMHPKLLSPKQSDTTLTEFWHETRSI